MAGVDARAALQAVHLQLTVGGWAEAERLLQRLLKRQPGLAEAHHLLAIVSDRQGRPADALRHAQVAVAMAPARPELQLGHGRALKAAGRLDEAVKAYRRALHLQPALAEAHVSLGIVHRLQGRLDEAIESHRQALRLRPDFPEALSNLGNALADRLTQGLSGQVTVEDLREAEQLYRRALALAPGHVPAMRNLALVLKMTGRYDEAVDLFNRALGAEPGRVETCVPFAELLQLHGNHDLARDLLVRWLGEHGGDPSTGVEPIVDPRQLVVPMTLLIESLVELGDGDAALSWLDRLDAIAPGSAHARHHRGRIVQQRWELDVDAGHALAVFRQAIEARPDYLEAVCSYLMTRSYVDDDPVAMLAEHRHRMAPVLAAVPVSAARPLPPAGPAVADPARRLRIGYVSHDFKRHSVAYFIEAVFAAHDRSRVELFGYQTHALPDAVTARLRASADHWVEANHLSDGQLAERVRADGVDILVDLNGLTSGGRIGLFQRRPAACQVTYLGYPTTTGADCFDARLTDAVIDPESEAADGAVHSSEPLLRLPGSMFCYRPGPAPEVGPLPALQAGHVTFGSFNNLSKASPATLQRWARVLLAVPGSRLLLKAQTLVRRANRDALTQRFAALGIDAERLLLQPWDPDVQAHLAAYNRVDIGLDTWPFTGATTTCEALWMGVPVLTRPGRSHPSRMGASILAAAGLAELVCADEDRLVECAVALAADLPRLDALRRGLRARLQASRLLDGAGFTRDFEAALDALWRTTAASAERNLPDAVAVVVQPA